MTATVPPSQGMRALVRSGARRIGAEDTLISGYERWQRIKAGPTARRNEYEHGLFRLLAAARLGAGSNCVDVGANEGDVLHTLVELAPHGHHVAFEPVPAVADRLAARFPGVDVRAAAVSDAGGQTSFVVHRELPTRSSMRPVGYSDEQTETITVPVQRLDDVLPAERRVDLLKVDVEGAEHLVLQGALEMLRSDRPLVVFEHQRSTADHYDTDSDELYHLLVGEAGLRVFDIAGGGPYDRAGFRDVVDARAHWNFFASGAPA